MQLLQVALTSLFSILVLFLLTKLIGYRQMSELSMFDYVNSISVGSIAAELSTSRGEDFGRWTAALVVYGLVTLALSLLTNRSVRLRRGVTGKPILLLRQGKLYDGNFTRAHLDLNEFLMQLRNSGYFDLSTLDTVLFEPNGKLSVLPKSAFRPATPQDLNAAPQQEPVLAEVILDGTAMPENLSAVGRDEVWLAEQLKAQRLRREDVFLAQCTPEGQLVCYPRQGQLENRLLE